MDTPIISFSKFRLDNGLTVVVHEDHKAPVVAVSVWYHVGSANEPAGKTGFAHLFEHLMYSGSEHHKDSFFKPFERVGATDMNGTTSLDRTNYFQTVPTTALDMALWMESDRMGHLLGAIGQVELDTQRGVVQNEKRQKENQPYGRMQENVQLNAFPANHPYQHTTIGSMADLDAASLDDVKQWFRDYYGAANTTLVLAGDITPERAVQMASCYFGDIPAGPPVERPAPWTVPRQKSTRGVQTDHVPQVRIIREWNVPNLGHTDNTLLKLAAVVLGGGVTSRLHQRLLHRDRLVDNVSVGLQSLALASMFLLMASIRRGVDPALVEAAMEDEWATFLRDGPSESELVRAKMTLRSNFVHDLEKVGGLNGKAAILAEGQVYRRDPAAYMRDLAVQDAATPAAVLDAARRWISEGDYTLTVMPIEKNAGPSLDDPVMPGLPERADKPAAMTAAARGYATVASTIDRAEGVPPVGQFPDLSFPPVQRARLKNGIEVIMAERHAIPVTQVQVHFDAGLAADHGRTLGTAAMTMSALVEGTQTLSSVQIAEQRERLGARLGVFASLDTCGVALSTLNAGIVASLELLADVVRRPAFRDADVERIRARSLASIQQELSSPAGLGNRLLWPLLYGKDHAYGIPSSGAGTEASVRSLSDADLRAFYADFIRPDNATIYVVGDKTLDAMVPLLDAMFGDWTAPSSPRPAKHIAYVAAQDRPRVFLIHREGALQSQVIAGSLVSPTASPWYLPTQMANAVIGGTFTSRLNMNLREEKRWSYGAGSTITDAIGQRPLTISAAVQADKTAESIREAFNELKAFSSHRPPTAAEIDRVKVQAIRMLPGKYETTSSILVALSNNQLYGRPDDYVTRLKQSIEAQTEVQVAAAAKEFFSPDAFTWIVIGDVSKFEQSVRALDIGEVMVLDAADIAGSEGADMQIPPADATQPRLAALAPMTPQTKATMHATRHGDVIMAALQLEFPAGFHAYAPGSSEGLPLTLGEGEGFGAIEDFRLDTTGDYLSGTVRVTFVTRGDADELVVSLRVQLCDDSTCLAPQTLEVRCRILASD